MSEEHQAQPAALSTDIVQALDNCSPELLRRVATYSEELAAHREREGCLAEESV